jgi:hypothetical protein
VIAAGALAQRDAGQAMMVPSFLPEYARKRNKRERTVREARRIPGREERHDTDATRVPA